GAFAQLVLEGAPPGRPAGGRRLGVQRGPGSSQGHRRGRMEGHRRLPPARRGERGQGRPAQRRLDGRGAAAGHGAGGERGAVEGSVRWGGV
ncbi:MAG: hypothetical protein AVDCRST_MAG68-4660, partial [uncultured Gemmatimonadetes bacterium]